MPTKAIVASRVACERVKGKINNPLPKIKQPMRPVNNSPMRSLKKRNKKSMAGMLAMDKTRAFNPIARPASLPCCSRESDRSTMLYLFGGNRRGAS